MTGYNSQNMMNTRQNIVYLIGAGASAHCLPVIDELPERIDLFISLIKEAQGFQNNLSPDQRQPNYHATNTTKLRADLEWLKEEMQAHNTVDTLAKKFYLLKDREADLDKLKKVLITYFMFEQFCRTVHIRTDKKTGEQETKELPDKRYDSFIATIIDKKRGSLSLSPAFKVITWNYDMQFELAYKAYSSNSNFKAIQEKLQAIPTVEYLRNSFVPDLSKFGLLRLNGLAGLTSFGLLEPPRSDLMGLHRQSYLVASLVNCYFSISQEDLSVFNYSWEDCEDLPTSHKKKASLLETACAIMEQATILVVIGYSFPVFNRSVDKKLLEAGRNLQKVYIQDTNAENMVSLVRSSFPRLQRRHATITDRSIARTKPTGEFFISIEPITGVKQFFIPPEADI